MKRTVMKESRKAKRETYPKFSKAEPLKRMKLIKKVSYKNGKKVTEMVPVEVDKRGVIIRKKK
tara:strand:- start:233 stop:421 length:189 start_codon:yes stop_codon:yes gene_type:complete